MAHDSRSLTNGHRTNGYVAGDTEVPQSTMAAQLISTIATGNEPSRPAQLDDLQRLMAEIAQIESQGTETGSKETQVQHAHKLIYLFTRTVLERLSQDDPFMNVPQMASQASDALDIFMTTIKEAPRVLEYVPEIDEVLQGRGQEPVWLWLLPKILVLLGREGCERLTDKIKDFLFVCFQIISGSPQLWALSSLFFSYIKDCVATVLDRLQQMPLLPSAASLVVKVPSNHFALNALADNEHDLIQSSLEFTYQLSTVRHGICHVTHLLSFLADVAAEDTSTHGAIYVLRDYLAWVLDSLSALHNLQLRQGGNALPHNEFHLQQMCLTSVNTIVSSFSVSVEPAIRRKACVILATLFASVLRHSSQLSGNKVGVTLASTLLQLTAICQSDKSFCALVVGRMQRELVTVLCDDSIADALGKDFKKASVSFCKICKVDVPINILESAPEDYDNASLSNEILKLNVRTVITSDESSNEPPQKRRRVTKYNEPLGRIVSELLLLLGRQNATDLYGLHQVAEDSYANLEDAQRSRAIELLGNIPCAASSSISVSVSSTMPPLQHLNCAVCDDQHSESSEEPDSNTIETVFKPAILVFEKLVQSQHFMESRRPRILAMLALRKFVNHIQIPELFDLSISSLGQWCLRSLRSSTRELRIAAGRTIRLFSIQHATLETITKKNRVATIEALHSIRDIESVFHQEACILAWGQLGRILDDGTLVFALLELVKYLGHPNPVVSGVAFNEILSLARAGDVCVQQLFDPFWDVVAYYAVKDLITRPQTTQSMAELLDIDVVQFLLLIQSSSLPYLVLNQDLEVIVRISQARQDDDRSQVLFQASNLVKILALLLQQNTIDTEKSTLALLGAYDAKFKDSDLADLMKVEPSTTAFYLLMAAGEADAGVKSRIRQGLAILASHAPGAEGSQGKKNKVGAFLEQHILGLANRLIDIIMALRAPFSLIERERAIKGVEELIKVARTHSRVARPQLCSCLQSAISIPRFQLTAFSAWDAMLRDLEDDDVETMLESTFSIIIQHWETFDESTRSMAHETLRYLLKHRTRLIRMRIVNLPSLAQLQRLGDIDAELQRLRTPTDSSNAFQIFSRRLRNENSGVVQQALIELRDYLHVHQSFLQASSVSEQPDPVVGLLIRTILDICIKFNKSQVNVAQISAECIGLIGCLDPNRVESLRERRDMVVVSNFKESGESTDFVLFTLQYILVPAFLSTTDTLLQGFFSFSMQQLLEVCDFRRVCGATIRSGQRTSNEPLFAKWQNLPGSIRDTLTPFLTSKYALSDLKKSRIEYPIFKSIAVRADQFGGSDKLYSLWLRTFVSDLLSKPLTVHAGIIFPALSRAIRIRDTTVAHFLLPYLVLHIILEGTDKSRKEIGQELLSILEYSLPANSKTIRREEWKSCLECVFSVLDYLSRWVQERQLKINQSRGGDWVAEVEHVKFVTENIPAEILSQAATECKSYSRALFYWEQHIRKERSQKNDNDVDHELLEKLQDIYSQIDEPDGIEGISAQLHVLDIEQQIIGHQKAGRWTAAQTWYEIKLAERPHDIDVQVNLLNCLKESGQHDVLLNYVEGMQTSTSTVSRLLPYATEASWATNRWAALEKYTSMADQESGDNFNIRIGQALLALYQQQGDPDRFTVIIGSIRKDIAFSLSAPMTASLAASHDAMLKLHVLTELEMIAGTKNENMVDRSQVIPSLNRRLEVIGAYLNDKQYLLGIRRAAMKLCSPNFDNGDIAEAWLTSARLARKGNAIHQSFNAVLHASQLGDSSATIEHARLIWKEGNHRKAIGILEGAIKSDAFIQHNKSFQSTTFTTDVEQNGEQNLLKARAFLMLAKWKDAAGQTNTATLRLQYQEAARTHISWEKGHYYLGRHYNKLLDSEKLLPSDQQKEAYLTGETAKLVIENYLRSLSYGTKYLYQTLPRIITLWLDLGSQINYQTEAKFGHSKEFVTKINGLRKQNLDLLHARFAKYVPKVPAYMFYTALPQILSRIAHPNNEVFKVLLSIILKVIVAFPQHTLWNLLAVCTSNQADRKNRGMTVLQTLQRKPDKRGEGDLDIRAIVKQGMKLTNELIPACNSGEFPNNRTSFGSLSKDLGFNTKACTPNYLVVPFESMLTASLPTLTDNLKSHNAFSKEAVTIQTFSDNVMILSSLQKPRKLTAIGSDGRQYGLMCKPKDDLRKDQRLMEFNSMINRALKRDAEASRRQLYIKTYAVTPLNEECGLIEWVDGLKTLRDILLVLLKGMGISPHYKEIEYWCEQALLPDKTDKQIELFQKQVLDKYPPVFHKWFVQQFPEPSAWFAARIRYTRSCAVMSMVGTILGLGDRHGENILFEEGNGGTFHVDFNCLFDKGLTFTKPERVPFRLTHNMTDAMGIYNYEGPFRKSAELTLKLLRQHEETLMTILEAFVYDPTLDLLNKKPEKKRKEGVPQTAQGVLDSIQRKVKGYLTGEPVPLGVEGQVEELIAMATNRAYLAGMYIGWCSFL